MIKNISILILILLLTPTISLAQDIPIEEYRCYSEFPNTEINYSFYLEGSINPEELQENQIIIQSFDEICRYSSTPTKCYECITLKRYNITENEEQNNINITKIVILITIIILLMLTITYQLRGKKKWKKKKRN